MTAITIPNSVTTLGGSCFFGSSSLTSIIVPNSVVYIGGDCFAEASYKIDSYPRNFETLKTKYGERVKLYGGPIYALQATGRTQAKLKFKVVPRTDIAYIPAENAGELCAREAIVYLGAQDSITIPNPSQDQGVFSGLVPNSPYRMALLVKYSDGCEMRIQYGKEITTLGTNPKISAAASSPTVVKFTGRFTLIDAHISEILINGQSVNPDLAVNVGDNIYEITIQETGLTANAENLGSMIVKTKEGSTETGSVSFAPRP